MKFPSFGKKKTIAESTPDHDDDGDDFNNEDSTLENGSEEESGPSPENVKSDLKSKGGGNFSLMIKVILGFFVLVLLAYVYKSSGKTEVQPSRDSVSVRATSPIDETTAHAIVSSEPFKKDINEFNQENASQALIKRESSQAVVLATNAPAPTPAGQQQKQDQQQTQQAQMADRNAKIQAANANQATLDKIRVEDFNNLIKALSMATTTENITLPVDSPNVLVKRELLEAQKKVTAAQFATQVAAKSTTVAAPSNLLFEAYQDVYATIDYAASTDDNPIIIATIHGGKLNGSKVSGVLSITENDNGKITFNQLKAPGQSVIAINAQGISASDRKMLVNGSLDRKLWTRYGMPFVASMAGAYGTILSTQGAIQTVIAGVGTTTQTPVMTDAQIAKAAAGQAIGQAAANLRATGSAAKPAFKVSLNQEIGVVFLADVLSTSNQ